MRYVLLVVLGLLLWCSCQVDTKVLDRLEKAEVKVLDRLKKVEVRVVGIQKETYSYQKKRIENNGVGQWALLAGVTVYWIRKEVRYYLQRRAARREQ